MTKKQKLFIVLCAFFICNALLAEFLGSKIFSLEQTFGLKPLNLKVLGYDLSFNLTCGVLLWPFVFITTDIINEYFGKKGVRFISFLTTILISYSFLMIYLTIKTHPADIWIKNNLEIYNIDNIQTSYRAIFGQGMWIISGSLTAFLLGQLIDVMVFVWLKKLTQDKYLWLRSTGSTLVSQLIDSFVVLIIAFYIGAGFPLKLVIAIGIVNYIYKFIVAIISTPLIYLTHHWIDLYLKSEN